MTLSDKRLAANRANALNSTGPRYPEGKAKSSLNSVKHGLFSPRNLLPGEDPVEFNSHAAEMLENLKPVGALESSIAARIISISWRLHRAAAAERALFSPVPLGDAPEEPPLAVPSSPGSAAPEIPDIDPDPDATDFPASRRRSGSISPDSRIAQLRRLSVGAGALNAFSRHESRLHRQISRDVILLHNLQAARFARTPPDPGPRPKFTGYRQDRFGRVISPYSTVPMHMELQKIEKELGLHPEGDFDAEDPG